MGYICTGGGSGVSMIGETQRHFDAIERLGAVGSGPVEVGRHSPR